MPRKEVITRDELLRNAFELAREEGVEEVTARKLANKAGCSTQPIFRAYRNMEEVLGEVMNQRVQFFERAGIDRRSEFDPDRVGRHRKRFPDAHHRHHERFLVRCGDQHGIGVQRKRRRS